MMTQGTEKRLCVGLLAHVDAGKTTLSEAMLYRAGVIRTFGRVDHGDTFLDTDAQERSRVQQAARGSEKNVSEGGKIDFCDEIFVKTHKCLFLHC